MMSVEALKQMVERAREAGEGEILVRVPAIDQSRPIPMRCQASGAVLLDLDDRGSPKGQAVHADVVWAVFTVRDVEAWLSRQEVTCE